MSAFLLQIVFNHAALAHLETAKLFPSDANAGDNSGISVAIYGNTAVVGAYKNDSNCSDCGAVYVYEPGDSQWIEKQKLVPSDGSANDQFGRSVAIEDNTIVVGSYYGDSNMPAPPTSLLEVNSPGHSKPFFGPPTPPTETTSGSPSLLMATRQ